MINYLSFNVPVKVKRSANKFADLLTQINEISGHSYRLYFDNLNGILVDITKNKILWIADATFSMAIFVARLTKLLEFWKYEKAVDKTQVDFVAYDNLRKYIKVLYYE